MSEQSVNLTILTWDDSLPHIVETSAMRELLKKTYHYINKQNPKLPPTKLQQNRLYGSQNHITAFSGTDGGVWIGQIVHSAKDSAVPPQRKPIKIQIFATAILYIFMLICRYQIILTRFR